MATRTYHDALELRLKDLTNRTVILKLRSERMEGINKLRYGREIERLEHQQQELKNRLRRLEREGSGFWEELKADIRESIIELPSVFERWIEWLDRNYAPGSACPETGNHLAAARDRVRDGDQ